MVSDRPHRLSYSASLLASLLAPWERVEELTMDYLGSRIATLTARASLALGAQNRVRFFGDE